MSTARRFSKSPAVLFTEAYEVVRLQQQCDEHNDPKDHLKNLKCWSCCATIQNISVMTAASKKKVVKRVVQVPLACVKGCLYNMHGVFCSLPCGQRFVQHCSAYPESIRRSVPRNIAKMRYQILSHCNPDLASAMCFYDLFVRSAPNPLILDIFGGFASRDMYTSMILECKRVRPRPITVRKLCGKDPLGGENEALPSEMRERIKLDTRYERILTVPILPGIQRLPSVYSLRCYVDLPLFHEDEDTFGASGCADARPAQHVVIHKSAPLPASVTERLRRRPSSMTESCPPPKKKRTPSVSSMLYKQRSEIRGRFKRYTPPKNYDFSDKGLRKTSRLSSRISIDNNSSTIRNKLPQQQVVLKKKKLQRKCEQRKNSINTSVNHNNNNINHNDKKNKTNNFLSVSSSSNGTHQRSKKQRSLSDFL